MALVWQLSPLRSVGSCCGNTIVREQSMTVRRWWAVLFFLLVSCASAPAVRAEVEGLPLEDDSAADCRTAAEDDGDEGCVTTACDGGVCGLYRCEDVASAAVAFRTGAPTAPMAGVGNAPQRYWGAPQVLPGREPVLVFRKERPEELPSQKALRKARQEWEQATKEKHHIFPRAFESYFASRRINIHEWTLAVDVKRHKEIHGGAYGAPWNADWRQFIERVEGEVAKKSDTTPEEVRRRLFDFAGLMIQKYRLVGMPMSYWQQLTANMQLSKD
ncbi:TIGR02269 family lipoprotein [Myxococcus sp. AS-1-15]|uniref:SitA6 family polymorphic toxin lipoprotein n=1 Tax=Myxococcus sp. AS-1-15 TaxID=2874600 RepID=UPI001CBCA2B3|nr:TIGR02269 family lipoprotein [Myxococcus sp. AS-1-15]MBZ4399386.1 TIGR02269 family lipoprotein [Myxococcus sp. AS-1-15]